MPWYDCFFIIFIIALLPLDSFLDADSSTILIAVYVRQVSCELSSVILIPPRAMTVCSTLLYSYLMCTLPYR